MPATPHPVTFTVYDSDNTTLLAGAYVLARNVTTGETLNGAAVTDANGQAILDLADLTSGYTAGDEVLLIAYKGNFHDASMYTITGNSKDITLYMNPIKFPNRAVLLQSVLTGNTAASVAYCKIYELSDGELIGHIETPANDSKPVYFKRRQCNFVVEREANTLIVTANLL